MMSMKKDEYGRCFVAVEDDSGDENTKVKNSNNDAEENCMG